MKSAINWVYILLVGLVLFVGALCIVKGASLKEASVSTEQADAVQRIAPGGAQTSL